MLQQLRGQGTLRSAIRLQEPGAIVQAEVMGVVLLAGQGDAFIGQDALQRPTMLGLIIDQHAVEIEQYRLDHHVSFSHATMFGQHEILARSLTTSPRCDSPGATASVLRVAPTRSTTCRHACGGA